MGSEFKIEKNVAMPEGRPAGARYPFGEMEVGDSFPVANTNKETLKNTADKLGRAAYYYGVRHDKKFTVRTFARGCRVWRVK